MSFDHQINCPLNITSCGLQLQKALYMPILSTVTTMM